ncbi:MAG: glycosyltransferase [Bacteroides sp.]|nr:glycosyltransferase [Bacteroides sp.]MBD5376066.1 glycosyltransferase [Bacteroides sp.]
MEFSVLMSVYCKEKVEALECAIVSLLCQTYQPSEIIIVEDGPLTSELYNCLDEFECKYPIIKRIKLSENGGLGKALNEGLKHCSHPIVARMDSDDIAKPYRFEKQIVVFQKYPQVEVVSSWIDEFIDTPENIISTRKLPEYPYQIFNFGKKRCPINHPAVMFKKESILFAGGYQHFPLFEDYYLWVRLLMNGAKFYNIQESLLLFRTSRDMYKRRGGLKHAINEIKFQRKIWKMGFITPIQFIYNISIRFVTRLAPNFIRASIYQRLLRN